ncbi:MAG: 50S ribosomal protein L14 [Patescibacteria group bacterium]
MVQPGSKLKVCDNSGALVLKLISILRGKPVAKVGDVVSGSVQKASSQGTVKEHDVVRAVVVRARKETRRSDGSYIRFDDNACVLVDKNGRPVGNRVFGPVAREIREQGFGEVASLAKEVV